MKRFAAMKRKEEEFIRLAWKSASSKTKVTEKDFYSKGHSMTLTLEELNDLAPVLNQGMQILAMERMAKEQNTAGLVLPDGEKTDGGIVLPPGVKLDA